MVEDILKVCIEYLCVLKHSACLTNSVFLHPIWIRVLTDWNVEPTTTVLAVEAVVTSAIEIQKESRLL